MSFCQICRHDTPGHYVGCPVLTGEPQMGTSQFPQQLQHGQQFQGGLSQQGAWAYQKPYGQSDTETQILFYLADIKAELAQIKELLAKKRRSE